MTDSTNGGNKSTPSKNMTNHNINEALLHLKILNQLIQDGYCFDDGDGKDFKNKLASAVNTVTQFIAKVREGSAP